MALLQWLRKAAGIFNKNAVGVQVKLTQPTTTQKGEKKKEKKEAAGKPKNLHNHNSDDNDGCVGRKPL